MFRLQKRSASLSGASRNSALELVCVNHGGPFNLCMNVGAPALRTGCNAKTVEKVLHKCAKFRGASANRRQISYLF